MRPSEDIRGRGRAHPPARSYGLMAAGIGWLVFGGDIDRARAQTATSEPGLSVVPPAAGSTPPASPYAAVDDLKLKGWNLPLPGAADTIDPQLFGLRQDLADAGIGYFGFTNSYFADNLLRHGLPIGSRQNQLYSGQLPTGFTSNYFYMTYDLSRYGIPDGQIVLGATFVKTTWTNLGPDNFSLSLATYYQSFLHKLIELKVGYIANSLEFLGTYVGGSLAGGVFGPNGSIQVEAGESTTVYPVPGIDVKVNLPDHFYDKLGVERALSPDGVIVENHQDGGGVRFGLPNSGVFVIDEAGYRINASPGTAQAWVRGAATYSSSNYQDFSKPGLRSDHDYALFLFADRQLWQSRPHGRSASQGLYAGFTVEYTPPALNRFTQYYEARLYGFGLIPGRPRDLASLILTNNVFSSDLIDTAHLQRQLTHRNSETLSVNYSAHVLPGVNLNGGLSFIGNPTSVTYTHLTGSSLNLQLGVVVFL